MYYYVGSNFVIIIMSANIYSKNPDYLELPLMDDDDYYYEKLADFDRFWSNEQISNIKQMIVVYL